MKRRLAGLMMLCLAATGCSLRPLGTATAAFSKATDRLVDNSVGVYRRAESLHDEAQGLQAVAHFDGTPPYNPYAATPLISEQGIRVRLEVLEGLRIYAGSLAELTGGKKSPALDAAAEAVGNNLKGMSATISSEVAASTGATNQLSLSQGEANAVSTAAEALGTFLADRKVKAALPGQIKRMQPSIAALCTLLESDLAILRRQSASDFQIMVADQDQFIRHNPSLTPVERREAILVLPRLVRSQRATDTLLAELNESIYKYNVAYQALAAASDGKDVNSFRALVADLDASSERLGTFYDSLPTK